MSTPTAKAGGPVDSHDADSLFDPALDYPSLTPPADQPGFGENHAFWIFDEAGGAFINVHIQTVPQFWSIRHETIGICLADGRALVDQTEGWNTTADTVGGAYVRATCVEPMRRWRLECAGTFLVTTQEDLARGPIATEQRRFVSWEADLDCSPPPYRTGASKAHDADGGSLAAGRFMGGLRYEQLFRAQVVLRIEGEPERCFSATGDRTHRAGPRNLGDFSGHDWKACLFPDGSGFNTHRYRRPDGEELWSEAFILADGKMRRAQILEDSWIDSLGVKGEPLRLRLASDRGEMLIEGETLGGVFRPVKVDSGNPHGRTFGVRPDMPDSLVLSQSWATYHANGQTARGLLERSSPIQRLQRASADTL